MVKGRMNPPEEPKCPRCDGELKFVGGEVYATVFGIKLKTAPNEYRCKSCHKQFFWHSRFGEFVTRRTGVYW